MEDHVAKLKLYDLEPSGNCYKVRLFCALLGLELDLVPVDFMAGAHKKSPLIDMNPYGDVPILEDGDVVLRDSQTILVYLARKFGGEDWLPTDPIAMAEIVGWLMVAENEIARGPGDARLHDKFGYAIDVERARENAARIQGLLEAHLKKNDWLARNRPTIADIACMPYVALGHEGGVSLEPYPAIRAWIGRIKALPGFITMPAL
jgi:glutathione S-transferase